MADKNKKLKYTEEERGIFTKAWRAARNTKKGNPNTWGGNDYNDAQGRKAVEDHRKRVANLKDYVDNDKDISVLDKD